MSGYQEPVGGTSSPSTGTAIGSKPIRAILRMFRGVNISGEAEYGTNFIPAIDSPFRLTANNLQLNNPAKTFYTSFESPATTENQTLKIPTITTTESGAKKDEIVLTKQNQAIKNKTIDINPASPDENQIYDDDADDTYLMGFDANGLAGKVLKSSIAVSGFSGAGNIAYINAANSFSALQTNRDNNWRIFNPALTFSYRLRTSAIGANVDMTLPQLTANDIFVFQNHSQDLANKAINTITNTLKNSGNFLIDVWKDAADSLWKARNTKTGVIISSNASPTTVIQAALNALTTGRTWQEGVKIHSPGANESIDIWQILIPSYTIFDYSECLLKTVRPAGMVDDGPANPNAYDGVSILTNTAEWDGSSMTTPAAKDITIICGRADGNRYNLGNDQPAGQNKNFFYFSNCTNVQIINPWVIRAQHDGIRLRNCTDCIIYKPYVEDNRSEGISFVGGSGNVIIDGEYLETGWSFFTALNCPRSLFYGGYGYRSVAAVSSSCNISSKKCIVDGFKATNVNGGGISFGDNDGSNSSIYDPDESIAINCNFDTIGTNGVQILSWRSKGLKVLNNTLANIGDRGIAIGGVNEDFVFQGNTVKECQGNGIYVSGSTTNDAGGLPKIIKRGIIAGNIIKNCGKDTGKTDANRSGILLTGAEADSITDTIVTQNHVYDTQGTKTTTYGVYLQNTLDCDVYQNNVQGNLTDGLFLTGTNNNLVRYNNRGHSSNQTLAFTNAANSFTALQTHRDNNWRIFNPALTFSYRLRTSAIGANVDMILPQLSGNDTFVFQDHVQTLTNKTLTSPTINGATASGTITVGGAASAPLTISKTAVASSAEKIIEFKISDDSASSLSIENATGSDASFVPMFICAQSAASTAGLFVGQGTTDTGTQPLFVISGRIGASTPVSTRPIFAVQNQTSSDRLMIWNATNVTFKDTYNMVFNTTTGTKIGTATTQKIGFWNAAPVVQPAAVADATDAASVITQLNALLSRLRTLGLIAT